MTIEECLRNCERFDLCFGKPKKNIGSYCWEEVMGTIVRDDEIEERHGKIVALLKKLGFKTSNNADYILEIENNKWIVNCYMEYSNSYECNRGNFRFKFEKDGE